MLFYAGPIPVDSFGGAEDQADGEKVMRKAGNLKSNRMTAANTLHAKALPHLPAPPVTAGCITRNPRIGSHRPCCKPVKIRAAGVHDPRDFMRV